MLNRGIISLHSSSTNIDKFSKVFVDIQTSKVLFCNVHNILFVEISRKF